MRVIGLKTTYGVLKFTEEDGAVRLESEYCFKPQAAEYHYLDGIESLLTALVAQGVDVSSKIYVEAVETLLDAMGNNT